MGLAPGSLLTRRLFVLAFTAAPTTAFAASCPPTKVLFVCPAGTVKSAIAREMLRSRATAEGLSVDVASRGLTPEDHVSPSLAAKLRADKLDPAREPALPLADSDVARADIVIAFADAASTPSWNADYTAAKADLDVRLDALVVELRQRAERCR